MLFFFLFSLKLDVLFRGPRPINLFSVCMCIHTYIHTHTIQTWHCNQGGGGSIPLSSSCHVCVYLPFQNGPSSLYSSISILLSIFLRRSSQWIASKFRGNSGEVFRWLAVSEYKLHLQSGTGQVFS
jgi:cytosine/uracil/thiamine/allantoin permease